MPYNLLCHGIYTKDFLEIKLTFLVRPFQCLSKSFSWKLLFVFIPDSKKCIFIIIPLFRINVRNDWIFTGPLNIEKFVKIAQDLGLFVLLRPGPYICAERNGGGLPWWLYKLHPKIKVTEINFQNRYIYHLYLIIYRMSFNFLRPKLDLLTSWILIQLRSSDPNFLKHVDTWWDLLLAPLKKHLYINGGNIIMVQIENEYGSYGCDIEYTSHLRCTRWNNSQLYLNFIEPRKREGRI